MMNSLCYYQEVILTCVHGIILCIYNLHNFKQCLLFVLLEIKIVFKELTAIRLL